MYKKCSQLCNLFHKRFPRSERISKLTSPLLDSRVQSGQGSLLGPLLNVVFVNGIALASSTSISYSALFADCLGALFIFKKIDHLKNTTNSNIENSLYKWHPQNATIQFWLKMRGDHLIRTYTRDLVANRVDINSNAVFLGIRFFF